MALLGASYTGALFLASLATIIVAMPTTHYSNKPPCCFPDRYSVDDFSLTYRRADKYKASVSESKASIIYDFSQNLTVAASGDTKLMIFYGKFAYMVTPSYCLSRPANDKVMPAQCPFCNMQPSFQGFFGAGEQAIYYLGFKTTTKEYLGANKTEVSVNSFYTTIADQRTVLMRKNTSSRIPGQVSQREILISYANHEREMDPNLFVLPDRCKLAPMADPSTPQGKHFIDQVNRFSNVDPLTLAF